jgi:predicted nucleic acid-binding protein
MKFLIDTNIPSELVRPRPNPGVIAWLAAQRELAISAVSVDESIFGLTMKNNQPLLAAYEDFLVNYCTVLPLDADLARRAGTLRANLAKKGFVRSKPDMMIAATAQKHDLTLVTRNTRDFQHCGIALLNPFTD